MMARHPDQPLIKDNDGLLRFKENRIVAYLAEGKLNDLARMPFEREDRVQLAQLIGYSLDGFAELSFVSDEDYLRAANQPAIDIEITSEDLTWLKGDTAWVRDIRSAGINEHVLSKYMPKELNPKTYYIRYLDDSADCFQHVYNFYIDTNEVLFLLDENGDVVAGVVRWRRFEAVEETGDNE